jgi:Holliday junction resolvase
MSEVKRHLGDSVYVQKEVDEAGMVLSTQHGSSGNPSNQIYLEPEVLQALVRFARECGMKL